MTLTNMRQGATIVSKSSPLCETISELSSKNISSKKEINYGKSKKIQRHSDIHKRRLGRYTQVLCVFSVFFSYRHTYYVAPVP